MKIKAKDMKNIIPDLTVLEYINRAEKAKLNMCRNVIAVDLTKEDNKMYLVVQRDKELVGLVFEEITEQEFEQRKTNQIFNKNLLIRREKR